MSAAGPRGRMNTGLHVQTLGHGPDLVLLHGWGLHGGVFAPLAERLADDFTLHVVDLPGHGLSRDSTVPLALGPGSQAIARQVPEGALWLGWSLGGLFALQAALTRPDLRGLVLVASSPRFVAAPDWPRGTPASALAGFADDLRNDYAGTIGRFLALDLVDAPGNPQVLRRQLLARGAPAPQAIRDGLDVIETTDLRPALASLPVPSLWLAGHRDRMVSPAAMHAAAALAPQARFGEIPGAGHAPFLARPDDVADQLRGFSMSLPA